MIDNFKRYSRYFISLVPIAGLWLIDIFYKIKRKNLSNIPLRGPFLIIVTNNIGDTITALPAIKAIREHFPAAKIDCLAQPSTAPLLRRLGYIDEVIIMHKAPFPSIYKCIFNIMQICRLRGKRYCTTITIASNFYNAWRGFLLGAKKRCGFSRPEKIGLIKIDDFGFLYTNDYKGLAIPSYIGGHANFIKALGLNINTDAVPEIPVPEAEIRKIEQYLNSHGVNTDNKIIVVNPYTKQKVRAWPVHKYIELINKLLSQEKWQIILTCAPDDAKMFEEVFKALVRKITILCNLNLDEYIALIKKASLVIGNDSGPLHIAYSVGTKAVGIFGPTDPKVVLPANIFVKAVWNELECSSSCSGTRDACLRSHHKCLEGISVAMVYNAVLETLSGI